MTKEQISQLEDLCTRLADPGWRKGSFIHLDGMQVVEALWPMNDVFRKNHNQISAIVYSPAFEAEADQALAAHASGQFWTISNPSAGAWRVLMERHIQSMTLALANYVQGNSKVLTVPQTLPKSHYGIAAMLFFQWSMVLPFPVENRASYVWPEKSEPKNLVRH